MRIGILSDIHEAVELLGVAIKRLSDEGVDRFVTLGDLFETGPSIDETVRLLESAGAIGVYGNHDYGLSVDPSPYVLERYSQPTLEYMGKLLPRMELEGCFFAHREPWLDCTDVTQIWHFDDEKLSAEVVAKSFDAVPNRSIFIGHFHRWQAITREGPLPWEGSGPLVLSDYSPTLVVVAAICDGHAAILDTTTRVLTPIDLYENRSRPENRPLPRLLNK